MTRRLIIIEDVYQQELTNDLNNSAWKDETRQQAKATKMDVGSYAKLTAKKVGPITFSADAQLRDLYFERKPEKDNKWRIDRYQAFGELNIGIDSIDLTAKAYIDFDQDQKDNNNRSAPFKVKGLK